MTRYEVAGEERVVFKSRLFAIARTPMRKDDGTIVYFEKVIRGPGVRVLIEKESKILIAKEYRYEFEGYDFRLPGGKLFEDIDSYLKNKGSDILKKAKRTAEKECLEETGWIVKIKKHLYTTNKSATIDLPLYYLSAEPVEQKNNSEYKEYGEDIEVLWKTKKEVLNMCLKGLIREEMTAAFLIRYLSGKDISK